jgi:ferritin-like metal-binding protein YciE
MKSKTQTTSAEDHAPVSELETKLGKLFEEELRDIYWAEKALTKAIPKMIKNASSTDLIAALETHLTETEDHVKRAEQVFEVIGKTARGKTCEAMEGLIKEAEEIMEESDEGVMRDAGIIAAAQKVEHYEIAAYGTLRTYAQTLGLNEAVSLLEKTLKDEKKADEVLTTVATSAINLQAAEEQVEE